MTIVTDWNGYKKVNFLTGGREGFIVCPENPIPGNPWAWRTEFFESFNYADLQLIKKGWHLAYHCVSDMYGCPESVSMLKEFYDVCTGSFGLNRKPVIIGLSRGGLYAVNFALEYPECCGLLYLDAPVLDIRSWPGGLGKGVGSPECWEQCKERYRLTDEQALVFDRNPLDRAEEVAGLGIPILLVCGAKDRIVPYPENGEPFYAAVKEAGGDIEQIVKPDCDHHPHSLEDPEPITDFIEKKLGFRQ